ncbi:hypothetical protein SAMN05428945_0914 [Streptomyces sp. 2224.1]|nr:hypothetical protein SAMN05428945_0914 [Streptomyces sp. 2224.1]SEE51148.1 hypothetical protein SAMN05428954_2837 [Streptomyces sp. 2112.3]
MRLWCVSGETAVTDVIDITTGFLLKGQPFSATADVFRAPSAYLPCAFRRGPYVRDFFGGTGGTARNGRFSAPKAWGGTAGRAGSTGASRR